MQILPSQRINDADEQILVVKRSVLFPTEDEVFHGLNTTSFQTFFSRVEQNKQFLPRSLMEQDPTYKQIIPYLVFRHQDTYFLMQRREQASEQRLKNKFSLGIGGHVQKKDIEHTDIMGWAQREFNEEIAYEGKYSVQPLGILNDDTNSVGKVHIGFALLIEGLSSHIAVRSELKSGTLCTLNECSTYYVDMEDWSRMLFNHLHKTA